MPIVRVLLRGWCPSIAWMNTHNAHMLALHS